IKGIWYEHPLEVIKQAFSEPAAKHFHTTPFKEYWKPSENLPEEQIFSEMYTANLFNLEYDSKPPPIYMYITNQTKYEHTKPSEFTAYHIAYIPNVSLNFYIG
ncbi:hypothetical protein BJ912DRAFT_862570, partial [Pholiota molesta]